ncbi:hypothetical protein HDZ31DRAFT_44813 [Schizophyllum fasciatum]
MSTAVAEEHPRCRLPAHVRPTHYDLAIQTNLEELTYSGYVRVSLDVYEETNIIVLNSSHELTMDAVTIYSNTLKTHQDASVAFSEEEERLTVSFPAALPATSKATLTIHFKAALSDSLMGYYKSAWEDDDGIERYYALTQFEPTAARRAFPCWDEPDLKATFAVSLISRAGTTSLSNTNAISDASYEARTLTGLPISSAEAVDEDVDMAALLRRACPEGKWQVTQFAPTPPMSTYIVAWANGEFAHLETTAVLPVSSKEIPLKIFATKDNIHQAGFALDVKAKVLPIYERIFDIGYPLSKLDTLVASDFDDGAMENWGLISGQASVLLVDPDRGDFSTKNLVACVISHEVAHMWFGNIATMRWWDNLYLNEGFATLVGEVIVADKLYPEWKLRSEFINVHWADALAMDAKPSSHPIEVECPDASQANQIFDDLSYSKAAAVLRMLAAHVGEELFLKGVSLYLKANLYGNTVTEDLWDHIGAATGQDIAALMTNWVREAGFPVLTVTEHANGINVRQDRFLDGSPVQPEDNTTIWNVPLAILTFDSSGQPHIQHAILSQREQAFAIDTNRPYKLNAGTTGVYHVVYTPKRFAGLVHEAAKEDSLFTLDDRMGLVHDAFATARAGLAPLSSALDLVEALKDEQEYLVWACIASNLDALSSIWWEHADIVQKLNALRCSLFVAILDRLGYEYSDADSVHVTQLRTLAVTQAVIGDDPGVIAELKHRFEPFLISDDDTLIPADLIAPVFICAVKYGGRAEIEKMREVLEEPKTPTYATAAIQAMCSSRDDVLLEEVMQMALHDSREQDVLDFFKGLQGNPLARRSLAGKVMENYDAIYERLGDDFSFDSIIVCPFEALSTLADHERTKSFFANRDTAAYDMSLAQALDNIMSRSTFIERSSQDLSQWLDRW